MPTQRIIRSPRSAAVSFARVHVQPFTDHAGELELSPQRLASYTAAVEAAEEALSRANEARQAWKAAASNAAVRMRELARAVTQAVEIIDLTASTAADPGALYNDALLTAPNTPGVMAPPGACRGLRAALNSDGSLTITWTCKNPANAHGTIYLVSRRLPGQAGYTPLGIAPGKRFTDTTLPVGAGVAEYLVQARRGHTVGQTGAILVQLGAVTSDTKVAAGAAKLAA